MICKFKNSVYLVLFLLVGCGGPLRIEIDDEFRPYYDRFNQHSMKYRGKDFSDTNITITFVKTINVTTENNMTILGVCHYKSNIVEINKQIWVKLPTAKKEAVIAHELGHCLLNRSHDEATHPRSQWRLSVMHPLIVGPWEFSSKYDYYMKELFLKQKDLSKFEKHSVYSPPKINTTTSVDRGVRYYPNGEALIPVHSGEDSTEDLYSNERIGYNEGKDTDGCIAYSEQPQTNE